MNINSVDALLTSNISDPTDFPTDTVAPGLRQLDAALRCNICGELFVAPVTLPCGHGFCSTCVRSAICEKPECPQCRKPGTEGQLRVNPAMEETVIAWKSARPFVLRLSTEEERRITQPPISLRQFSKKRKRSHPPDIDMQGAQSIGSPYPSKGPRGTRSAHQELDDDELEVPTSDSREDDVIDVTECVQCPLCSQRVKFNRINDHMDQGCPTELDNTEASKRRMDSKTGWSKLFGTGKNGRGKEREELSNADPLPKATYSVLKDRQLKDLLSEYNLPLTGDRKTLISRHSRWVLIYNANLDRSPAQRQSLAELKRALRIWETENAQAKTEIADIANYERANKEQFKQLVEAARPKKHPPNETSGSSSSSHVASHQISSPEDASDIIIEDSEEDCQ